MILHCGAEHVDYDAIRAVETPDGTDTHVPIPHHQVVEMVRYSLGFYGHSVIEEVHALTPDHMNYFGLLKLKSDYGDYVDVVALRNSHSKRFPIGIAMGGAVMVCDNLSLCGETVIRRKHTSGAKRALPGLVAEAIEPLKDQRQRQAAIFESYRQTALLEAQVNDAIMKLYRKGIINVTRVADVLDAYTTPPHDWGPETAWRLFNATTYALTGRVAENPQVTRGLHDVIDSYCTPVDPNQLRLPELV